MYYMVFSYCLSYYFIYILIYLSSHVFFCTCPHLVAVFRLVEEVKLRASSCQLQNEDVYMNTTFQDFIQMCVRKLRGEDDEEELVIDYVSARYP